ncbi:MAG: hypothetical protein ABI177_00105 [Edaphobacter sp.]
MRKKILLLALIVAVLAYFARYDEIDDAFIYARYIANALSGLGMVFNAGEHVNALSSPFFGYMLLGLSWVLKGHVLLATKILSATGLFGACVLAERMVPYAGFLVASTGYFYSLVGMETSVFLFLLLLVVFLYQEKHYEWMPTALVLLTLTRFEGGILGVIIVYRLWRAHTWPTWKALVPATLIGVGYLLLNYHWYGQLLPSSAGAKFGQGLSGYWGKWPWAYFDGLYQLKHDFVPTLYVVPLVVFFGILGFRKMRSSFNELVPVFCALLLSFYILFNLPGYRWYSAPLIFFAMIYAARGLPKGRATLPVFVAIAVLMIATNAYNFPRSNDGSYYVKLGHWIDENTPTNARIEADETGTIGWYSHRYLIDILGLTTPKNAIHIAHRDPSSWLAEDKPDYIIVHDSDWIYERVAKTSPDYERVSLDLPVVYVLKRKTGGN